MGRIHHKSPRHQEDIRPPIRIEDDRYTLQGLHNVRQLYMRNWYRRIKKRRGSKIARVAVMRRLTTILWHMMKYKQPYVCGGPQKVTQMQEANAVLN